MICSAKTLLWLNLGSWVGGKKKDKVKKSLRGAYDCKEVTERCKSALHCETGSLVMLLTQKIQDKEQVYQGMRDQFGCLEFEMSVLHSHTFNIMYFWNSVVR